MTLPESPRVTPPETSSNKLLNQFRSTLDKRWSEFDVATLREAGWVRLIRDNHADFIKAKASFEWAKKVLGTITTDKELKAQLNAPGVLAGTIADLESYFSTLNAQDKQKEYNKVVASTIADLSSLKAQVSGTFDDARKAEQARATANTPIPTHQGNTNPLASLEASIPEVATVVTGLWATAASTGLVSEWWLKTKMKWWVTDFEEWITELLPDGEWKTKITGFFTMLKVKLGITKPDESKPNTPESTNFISDATYTSTVTIVRKFFLPKDSWNAWELYAYKTFWEKTFSELSQIYANRGSKSIKEALNIPKEAKITDKELEVWLAAVVDESQKKWKIFVSQCRRTCGPDFSKLTMFELFQKVWNPLSYLKTLAQIDVTDNPQELFANFGFEIDKEWKWVGDLAEKADKLSLSARKIFFISAMAWARYTNTEQWMTSLKQTLNWGDIEKDPKLKKECEDILKFGEAFRWKILNNPSIHLGYKEKFQEVFDKKWLSFRGLATLYCMLDGKTDFESMTWPEKLWFYWACGMLASEMDSFEKWGFSTAYLKKLWSDSHEVPEDVKEFWKEVLGWVTSKIASGLWESAKFILWVWKEAPELALGALALWYFWWKARKRMHQFTHH